MQNTIILFILQFLLFIQVNSSVGEDIDSDIFNKELSKCLIPFINSGNSSSIDVDKCTAISPSLESLELGEMYKGKCCKLSIFVDNIYYYKRSYGENWEKMIKKEFNIEEDITEEEIRSKYLPSKNQDICFLLLDSLKGASLYQMSLTDSNRKVKYDCGNGEEIFSAKDYHPTDEDELIDKESIDCYNEFTEKGCNKRSTKLSSDDNQCCWCEKVYLQSESKEKNRKECEFYRISRMKELLQKQLKNNKDQDEKFEYKCDCYNRKGNKIKASYNTMTGDILIQ